MTERGLIAPFLIQLRHALAYANERAIKATLRKAHTRYLDAVLLPLDYPYIKAIPPLLQM